MQSNGSAEADDEDGLAVPVAWVKRTLCDIVQAREAHEVGVVQYFLLMFSLVSYARGKKKRV